MREFYGLNQSSPSPLPSPASGQLVAVRAEEEEEILRAQVCEVMADKVKVRGQGNTSHDGHPRQTNKKCRNLVQEEQVITGEL